MSPKFHLPHNVAGSGNWDVNILVLAGGGQLCKLLYLGLHSKLTQTGYEFGSLVLAGGII